MNSRSPSRPWIHHLGALALYTALAAITFRQYWSDPFRLTAGGVGDASQMIWFLRWFPFAVAHAHNPLVTTWVLYPSGANLMWNTSIILPSVLMAPVTVTAGPVLAYNLLYSVSFILSGWVAYIAIARLTGSAAGALAAGAVYAFSPFALAHGAGGQAQLFINLFPPLALLLLYELGAGRRAAWKLGVGLGVASAAQLLTGEELLAMTALTAAVGLLLAAALRPNQAWRRVPRLAAGLGWSLAAFIPLALIPLLVQFRGPQRPTGLLHTDLILHHNDLLTFAVPNALQQLDPASLHALAASLSTGGEQTGYVGLPLLVLLVIALARIRRDPLVAWAALTAMIMFLLSLGDTLYAGGRSTGIPLPWRVFDHVPLLGNTLSSRLVACGYLLCGVVVAGAIARATAREGAEPVPPVARLAFAGLAALSLLALAPTLQFPTGPQEAPAFFRTGGAVNRLAPGEVTVMVPFVDGAPMAMMWQATADMRYRTPSGYLFIPGPNYPIPYAPPSPLRNALDAAELGEPLTPLDPAHRAAMAADLDRWHARALIVGPIAREKTTVAFVTALLRRPPERAGGVDVWWNVDPSEAR